MLVTLNPPSNDVLLPASVTTLEVAKELVIATEDDYAQAASDLKTIKKRREDIDTLRKTVLEPLKKAADEVNAIFKPAIDNYALAEETIRAKGSIYLTERERLAAEARKKAEAEAAAARAALEEEARRQREEAEKAAAKLREEASRASAAGDSEGAVKLAGQASATVAAAEEKAHMDVALAQATIATPIFVPAGKGGGREVWEVNVTNLEALVKFVAANPAYVHVLKADNSQLTKVAQTTKGKLKMDGVVFTKRVGMVAR